MMAFCPLKDVEAALDDSLRALRQLGYALPRRPRVDWDLRGMAAGQAHLQEQRIRLNRGLLEQEGSAFARDTLLHELSHLAIWQRYGRRARPHGPQWRGLMEALGANPRRCHAAAVTPARQQRRFRYACACGEQALTTVRHHRALRGVRYLCRRCAQALRPLDPGAR